MTINRWVKFLLIASILFIVFTVLILPPIVKSYIQAHSKEWLGRSISIEGAELNVFNGSFTLTDFKLYEKDRLQNKLNQV